MSGFNLGDYIDGRLVNDGELEIVISWMIFELRRNSLSRSQIAKIANCDPRMVEQVAKFLETDTQIAKTNP